MVTTKISQSYFRCAKLFIHRISCLYQLCRWKYSRLVIVEFVICRWKYSRLVTVELRIYHFRHHTIYCSSVFAKLLKNNILSFPVVFLIKLSKFQSLKLNISRTAWPILMILVSFCKILNGLSDEINLFWHCSSPLSKK